MQTFPLGADVPPLSRTGAAAVFVPGYELLGELGRGGMGVVYKARHLGLNRVVALKMVLSGGHATVGDLDRFHREAKAVAKLQHPNIVQIHDIGQADGLPYFSLEYCIGGSLAAKLNGTPLPPRQSAELIETLARAMHAAHQAGVVHRDLKPANILFANAAKSASGELSSADHVREPDATQLTGLIPKVTDFGLAKTLEAADGPTQSGAVLGTPSYMAPEQAAGTAKRVGTTADVYSLGAILYECLTGRPPFKAATSLHTILQVIEQEPVSPSRLNTHTPRDLETVALKCLAKNPSRRYSSAEALADDLGRWRRGEPITARQIPWWGRAARWARRRPAAALLIAVTAVAITSLLGGGLWYNARLVDALTAATAAKASAEQEAANTRAVNAFLTDDLLSATQPERMGKDVTIRQAVDAAVPRIERAFADRPLIEATVRHTVGVTYIQLGRIAAADSQLQSAWQTRRDLLGDNDPATLEAARSVALVLWGEGRLEEAERMFQKTLAAQRRVLGPEHVEPLRTANMLAGLMDLRGNPDEAELLLRKTLSVRRRTLGDRHPDTLESESGLGRMLTGHGRASDGEPLLQRSVKAYRAVLGSEHPRTLTVEFYWANALLQVNKPEDAERLARQTLATRRRILGTDHPDTMDSVKALAASLQAQGKSAEAEPLYREQLDGYRRSLGPDHAETALAELELADFLIQTRRPADAEPLLRHSVATLRNALGPNHKLTQRAEQTLTRVTGPSR